MYGFSVVLSAETASFRDPSGQLYHATFPLPPLSTLIGIAGAAIGMDFQQIWEFFKKNDIRSGVKDINEKVTGKGIDLWKYQKIVSKETRGDILKREFLFQVTYGLYYGCNILSVLEEMRKGFVSPAWALSLGSSDDIAIIKAVSEIQVVSEGTVDVTGIKKTLIPGDYSKDYSFDWQTIKNTPVRTTLELPVVKQLPVDYVFTEDGERKGSSYKPFTFLTGVQQLKSPCQVFNFENKKIPLIPVG
ncbi:CRISPR-associated protein Cas5 [Phosphitispora fastidiosa]|uniref:CRISPR-associated protein Cas5 n=1 Tax=Phosphitispora fastidiosa TaxID=2837202 RepID=UPI001E58F3D3|nr:CRISPR-associated protein Cas5 [Phosphitispora fastidiosa]